MSFLPDVLSDVRRMAGKPDTTELSETDLIAFVEDALAWVNRRAPGSAVTYVSSVVGQQDYDMPETAYDVTDVFWNTSHVSVFSGFDEPMVAEALERMRGYDVVENPALVEALLQAFERFRQNFDGQWKREGHKIRIFPCPDAAGERIYMLYTYPLYESDADLPASYLEPLKYYSAYLVLEHLAIRRGVIRSGRDFSGGGGVNEKERAKACREEAESMLPQPLMVIGRG